MKEMSQTGSIPFVNEVHPGNERVVRQGKVVTKRKVNPGFKMQAGKPVRMTPGEQQDKQRQAVKGARTRKGASMAIARKRERSLNKRKTMGI